jgi:hypothetical protein
LARVAQRAYVLRINLSVRPTLLQKVEN